MDEWILKVALKDSWARLKCREKILKREIRCLKIKLYIHIVIFSFSYKYYSYKPTVM